MALFKNFYNPHLFEKSSNADITLEFKRSIRILKVKGKKNRFQN